MLATRSVSGIRERAHRLDTTDHSAMNRMGSYMMVLPWDLQFPGGVNQVVINLDRELRQSALVRPIVLISDWNHPKPTIQHSMPVLVRYRLREPAGPMEDPRSFIAWFAYLPGTLLRLRRLMNTHMISVINVHYPTLSTISFAFLKALRLARFRFIVSFHGQDAVSGARLRGLQRWLFRFMLRSADAITACSEGFAKQVRDTFRLEESAVHVIHNGVDPHVRAEELSSDRSTLDRTPEGRYILCVSGFVAKKAIEVLIRAFALVRRNNPDLHLVVAGRSGPELDRVLAQIRRGGLDRYVTVHVDVPHETVTRLMKRAALFVLPSREEPFGIVLLEAGLAKLPVVATRVGGVPEIISSPEFGVLVKPDDEVQLAEAMERLLANPVEAKRLGESLFHRVSRHFTASAVAEGYLRVALPSSSRIRTKYLSGAELSQRA